MRITKSTNRWLALGTALLFGLIMAFGFLGLGETFAQVAPNVPSGDGLVVESDRAGINVPLNADLTLDQAVRNLVNYVLGFLALIAVIMIIYAGIRLIVSAGNEDARDTAKKILTYSIIGLILVALSWSIVAFVVSMFGGADDTDGDGLLEYSRVGGQSVVVEIDGSRQVLGATSQIPVPFSNDDEITERSIILTPSYDQTLLDDVEKAVWETVRYRQPAVSWLEYLIPPAMAEGEIEWTGGIFTENSSPVYELCNVSSTVLGSEGGDQTCSNSNLAVSLKMKKGEEIHLQLSLYGAGNRLLDSNTFKLQSYTTNENPIPVKQDPTTNNEDQEVTTQDDPGVVRLDINGNQMRSDSRNGADYHEMVIDNQQGNQMFLNVFFNADNHPSQIKGVYLRGLDGQNYLNDSNVAETIGPNKLFARIDLSEVVPTQQEIWVLDVVSAYANAPRERTKTVYLLFNGAGRATAQQHFSQNYGLVDPGTELHFNFEGRKILTGGIITLTGPRDVKIGVVPVGGDNIYSRMKGTLDGTTFVGEVEEKMIDGTEVYEITIPSQLLLQGRTHRFQVVMVSSDGKEGLQGQITLNVGANGSEGLAGPSLSPRLIYPYKAPSEDDEADAIKSEDQKTKILRESNSYHVLPLTDARVGVQFRTQPTDDNTKFYLWTKPAAESEQIVGCRWDFGNERVVERADCSNFIYTFDRIETINGRLSYRIVNGNTRDHRFTLDIQDWGPEFTVEPRGVYLNDQVKFTPEENILDENESPLLEQILEVDPGTQVERLALYWSVFATQTDAREGKKKPLVLLQELSPSYAFSSADGLEPGKDYYVRFQADYAYVKDGKNEKVGFFNVKPISVLNKRPQASFSIDRGDPEKNNSYILNASRSFDPDSDGMSYKWEIKQTVNENGSPVNTAFTAIPDSANKQKPSLIIFKEGTYVIRLTISDGFGFDDISEQTLNQEYVANMDYVVGTSNSNLTSDKGVIARRVGNNDVEVIFRVGNLSNNIDYIEWDFGDGNTDRTLAGTNERRHTYTEAGDYTISAIGYTDEGQPIRRTKKLYVTAGDQPKGMIDVTFPSGPIFPVGAGQSSCVDSTGKGVNTYLITRGTQINFDAGKSINRDGNTAGLSYRWNLDGTQEKYTRNFTHRFTQILRADGCIRVGLTVVDENTNKVDEADPVYFQIVNTPPTIGGVRVYVDKTETPARIRTYAENVRDEDGQVTKYTWFYYEQGNDPNVAASRVETIETTTPNALFTVPSRGAAGTETRYVFAVIATDNQGLSTASYEILNEAASTITVTNTPPPTLSLDLFATPTAISTGQSLSLRASARLGSGAGSVSGGLYSYDVDGDGDFDFLNQGPFFTYRYTGKEDVFTELEETSTVPITLNAQVFYQGQVANATTTVQVKHEIVKPVANFDYRIVEDRVYYINESTGKGLTYEWDLDARAGVTCENQRSLEVDANIERPSKRYDTLGGATVRAILVITDENGEEDCIEKEIELLRGSAPAEATVQLTQYGTSVRAVNTSDPRREMQYEWFFNVEPGVNYCENPVSLLGSTTPDSTSATPNYTYDTAGTYQMVVLTTAANGTLQCTQKTVQVTESQANSSSTFTLQADRTEVMVGETVYLKSTLTSASGELVRENVFNYDIDGRTGNEYSNKGRVVSYSYDYNTYQDLFTEVRPGVYEAVFPVMASTKVDGQDQFSNPVSIVVTYNQFSETVGTPTLSANKQEVRLGEPLLLSVSANENLDNVYYHYDINEDGVNDYTYRGPQQRIIFDPSFLQGKFKKEGNNEVATVSIIASVTSGTQEVKSTKLPVRIIKTPASEATLYAVEVMPSSMVLELGESVDFAARAPLSDGSMVTSPVFSYDIDGDGQYEFENQGTYVRYTYRENSTNYQWTTAENGRDKVAEVPVQVRVTHKGKNITSSPVTLTVVDRQGTYLRPEVYYISPNPGPYTDVIGPSGRVVVPLESAQSNEGIEIRLKDLESNASLESLVNGDIEWTLADGTTQTLAPTDPLKLNFAEAGDYTIGVSYTVRGEESREEQYKIVVRPWNPVPLVTPAQGTEDTVFQFGVNRSIVEDEMEAYREHIEATLRTSVSVKNRTWTIRKQGDSKVLYTTNAQFFPFSFRNVEGLDAEAGAIYEATYEVAIAVGGESSSRTYSGTTTFTVGNRNPQASFAILENADKSLRFDASSSFDPDGDSLSYQWTIATPENVLLEETTNEPELTWKSSESALVLITLVVTDSQGGEGSKEQLREVVAVAGSSSNGGTSTEILQSAKADFDFLVLSDGSVVLRNNALEPNLVDMAWDFDTSEDLDGNGRPDDDVESNEDVVLIQYEEEGTYPIQLTVQNADGDVYQKSQLVEVKNSAKPTGDTPKAVALSLPKPGEDGLRRLQSENPMAVFVASDSGGDIDEYRYDVNIAVDSDGDGIPDNDVDNASHPSLYTGEPFDYTYDPSTQMVEAKLTVVTRQGETSSETMRFVMSNGMADPQYNVGPVVINSVAQISPDERAEKARVLREGINGLTISNLRKNYFYEKIDQLLLEDMSPKDRAVLKDEMEREIDQLLITNREKAILKAHLDDIPVENEEVVTVEAGTMSVADIVEQIKSRTSDLPPRERLAVNRALGDISDSFGRDAALVRESLDDIAEIVDASELSVQNKTEVAGMLTILGNRLNNEIENTVENSYEDPTPVEDPIENPVEDPTPVEDPEDPNQGEEPSDENQGGFNLMAILWPIILIILLLFGFLAALGVTMYVLYSVYKSKTNKPELEFEEFMMHLRQYMGELFAGKKQTQSGETDAPIVDTTVEDATESPSTDAEQPAAPSWLSMDEEETVPGDNADRSSALPSWVDEPITPPTQAYPFSDVPSGTPSWLQDTELATEETNETEQDSSDQTDDSTPSWLQGTSNDTTESTADTDTPAWLQDAVTNASDDSDTPPWLQDSESDIPSPIEADEKPTDTPSWLSETPVTPESAGDSETESSETVEPTIETQTESGATSVIQNSDLPPWLQDIPPATHQDENTTEPVGEEMESSEEAESANDTEQSSSTLDNVSTTDSEKEESKESDLPPWLQDTPTEDELTPPWMKSSESDVNESSEEESEKPEQPIQQEATLEEVQEKSSEAPKEVQVSQEETPKPKKKKKTTPKDVFPEIPKEEIKQEDFIGFDQEEAA